MMTILGIETSCDETSAAVVRGARTPLSCVTRTHAEHAAYGGVVPEIASRRHTELLPGIVREAVARSGAAWRDIDGVAATRGPGLASSLLVGWEMAKGLAARLGKPLFAVNHTEAHIHSVFLGNAEPRGEAPMLALVASGGHTAFFIEDGGALEMLGRTVDDAAGEALDKAAKMLGLGYPGGPVIDRISRGLTPAARAFPEGKIRPQAETGGLDGELCVSFSGLKTALLHRIQNSPPESEAQIAQTACDYQEAVVEALARRCARIMQRRADVRTLACGGGVSLNSRLRARLAEICAAHGARLLLAAPEYCGDNAAMVAGLAAAGRATPPPRSFAMDILPNWEAGAGV